ncbi:MAG: hypothetical protein R6U50_02650 [Desulfobacterales bacterium]
MPFIAFFGSVFSLSSLSFSSSGKESNSFIFSGVVNFSKPGVSADVNELVCADALKPNTASINEVVTPIKRDLEKNALELVCRGYSSVCFMSIRFQFNKGKMMEDRKVSILDLGPD